MRNAALDAALKALATQYTTSVPAETLALFPHWHGELLPAISEPSEIRATLEELEETARRSSTPESALGYIFSINALQAALDIHDFYGSGSAGGVLPAPSPSAFERCASGHESELLVRRLMSEAPPALHYTFPNFVAELRAATKRPIEELRVAVARLEVTHAELSVRGFTEEEIHGRHQAVVMEVQAMAFAVRAIRAVVQTKSAVAVADAVASAVAASRRSAAAAPLAAVRPFAFGVPTAPSDSTTSHDARARIAAAVASRGGGGASGSSTMLGPVRALGSAPASPLYGAAAPADGSRPPAEWMGAELARAEWPAAAAAAVGGGLEGGVGARSPRSVTSTRDADVVESFRLPPSPAPGPVLPLSAPRLSAPPPAAAPLASGFRFRSLSDPTTSAPGDAFNPCCEYHCETDGSQIETLQETLWLLRQEASNGGGDAMGDNELSGVSDELERQLESHAYPGVIAKLMRKLPADMDVDDIEMDPLPRNTGIAMAMAWGTADTGATGAWADRSTPTALTL